MIRNHRLGLAVLLLVTPVAAALSQDAAPAPAGEPEVLEELDEVLVRGQRLVDAIVEAENRFYTLYNQVNKDDRYDVNCANLNISANSGSRINSRLCIPGFVADAIADYAAFKVSCEPEFSNFDANRDGRISRMEAMANPDLYFQFDSLDVNGDDVLNERPEFQTFYNWALVNLNCYRPPPPELVLMEGTDRWYQHMMQVTNSDPRLREMAGDLDDLHAELSMVRRRYQAVVDEQSAGRTEPARGARNTGPRPR